MTRSKIWLLLGLLAVIAATAVVTVAKRDDERMLLLVRQETLTADEERVLTSYYNWEWELTWPSPQFREEYESRFGKPDLED